MEKTENKITIDVPPDLERAMEPAILRAGYLFPDIRITADGSSIVAQSFDPEESATIEKEIKYLLYREHVRQEFAPYRKKALDRVYGGAS